VSDVLDIIEEVAIVPGHRSVQCRDVSASIVRTNQHLDILLGHPVTALNPVHNPSSCRTHSAKPFNVICCFDFFFDTLGLCFGERLEFVLKAHHAGDATATLPGVVDDFMSGAEDFAW